MTITRYQKAHGVEKHRSEITLAEYNPRRITPNAMRRLKDSIKTFGLLEPFIWNETTGNLVGGHQRLAALDDLEKSEDYSVAVTVVKLPIEKEKALNLALNNPSLQGEYDVSLIDEMLRNNEFDFNLAGFSQVDLEMMYVNAGLETTVLDQMFSSAGADTVNAVADVVDRLQDKIDGRSSPDDLPEDEDPDADESPDGGNVSEGSGDPTDDKALIKQRRKEFAARAANENENDFFVTAVFTSDAEKHAFLKAAGFNQHAPHIDGWRLAELCGIELDKVK